MDKDLARDYSHAVEMIMYLVFNIYSCTISTMLLIKNDTF